MLVSLAITLIMMGAVVTLFGVVSESVSKSRSLIETSDRLRAAREVIQQDLQGATASLTPPLSPENGQGYFEIIEGQSSDGGPTKSPFQNYGANTTGAMFGDCDDVLMLTVRSRSGPFLGKYSTGGTPRIIESPVAEVVYFLVQDGPIIDATLNPPIRLCTLYRRVLLVSPSTPEFSLPFADFYALNDISAHYRTFTTAPSERLVPNTLGDLTKRENRFAHYGDLLSTYYGQHPFHVNTAMLPQVPFAVVPTPPTGSTFTNPVFPVNRPEIGAFLAPLAGARLGDDVLLTNVIAFDVRVWDAEATLWENGGIVAGPGDPGWNAGNQVGTGAYVDLGYSPATLSQFADVNPDQKPRGTTEYLLGTNNDNRIYDTWSLHYENDGIDQDGQLGADAGTNGLDDDGDGLIDEQEFDPTTGSEWDTQPPYATPIRGVQITLRVYEPSSQQVREVVIVQNFDTKK